ncbi:hypothetical protein DV26_41240 [Amycolatopsis mediterranei]|uniref:Uncharacterized protein n=1 Tax=Amycolatopsis mediterranei (strain S699) TaxID=713604 RepID=A0A9R0P599_AMYMS|nr:hypothetical protein RAM_40175 [Amycolatopsis mediterranei S699]KDO04921.1 hypothetical protein DV26_41240 [Amycolatopsis mediterranei]KDU89166.1 hypothetical protein DV36_26615 [Amycolatopsis mediterranei]
MDACVSTTTSAFLDPRAAGEAGRADGLVSGEVTVEGPAASWSRRLATTGYYSLQVGPELSDA